jgi:hypothetical protein
MPTSLDFPKSLSKYGPAALSFHGWKIDRGNIKPRKGLPDLGGRQLQNILERNSVGRNARILKRIGLIALPSLAKKYYEFVSKADRARLRFEYEQRLPQGKSTALIRFAMESYRAFTASLSSHWESYEVPSRIMYEVHRYKLIALKHPKWFATSLKETLQELRDRVLGGKIPKTPFSYFYPTTCAKNMLQASAALRALPAPLGKMIDKRKLWTELRARLTTSPPPPDPALLAWIREWVSFNQPYFPRGSWSISPSVRATLEFGRSDGGFAKAILQMTADPRSYMEDQWYERESKVIKTHCRLEQEDADPYLESLALIASAVSALRPLFKHARKCTGGCSKHLKHPPMAPIVVPERGLKTRIPTMTIAPIGVLSRVLRSICDPFLRSDPRIRPSLEGAVHFPEGEGPYRSQDLTTATDCHNVEVTRFFYLEVGNYIDKPPWYDDVVYTVCNYFTVLSHQELIDFREGFKPTPLRFEPNPKFFRMMNFSAYYVKHHELDPVADLQQFMPPHPTKAQKAFFNPCDNVIDMRPHRYRCWGQYVTKRGMPMGIPTSWPLLPILTLFAYETSSLVERKVIRRKVRVGPKSYDLGLFTSWCENKGRTKTLERTVPENYALCLTTGDDAVMSRMEKFHSTLHTSVLQRIGCTVSSTKDYYHPRLAIYTEVFFEDGKTLGIFPWAPILAPKGVRTNTWYSQPSSLAGMQSRHSVEIPFHRSPYWLIYKQLGEIGIPVGAHKLLGGLGSKFLPQGRAGYINWAAKELEQLDFYGLLKPPPEFRIYNLKEDGLLLAKQEPVRDKAIRPNVSQYDAPKETSGRGTPAKRRLSIRSKNALKFTSAALAVRCKPSPYVEFSVSEWSSICRARNGWDQIRAGAEKVYEPTVAKFISRWRSTPIPPLKPVEEIVEEAEADLRMKIKVPYGILIQFRSTFGFIRPFTPVPVFQVPGSDGSSREVSIPPE